MFECDWSHVRQGNESASLFMTSPNSSVLTILFLSNNSTHLGSGRTFLLIELWETTTVHFTKTRNCWDYLVMCHTVSCILLLFLSENKDSILTFYAHSLPRHRTFCNSFYSEKSNVCWLLVSPISPFGCLSWDSANQNVIYKGRCCFRKHFLKDNAWLNQPNS